MSTYVPFSLRFWQALQRPPVYHSLFRRAAAQYFRRPDGTPIWGNWSKRRQYLVTAVLAAITLVSIFTVPQLLTFMIFVVPSLGTVIYIMLHGTLVGLQQCLRITGIIARARERGMFDLLALAPLGAFGITWTLCTGSIYYGTPASGSGVGQRVWISRIMFLAVMLLIALMTLAAPSNIIGSPSGTLFLILLTVALVGFGFFLDDMLSSVIGILVGLIVPLLTGTANYARTIATVIYLLLQFISYLLTWLVGFIILPEIALSLPIAPFLGVLMLRLAQIGVMFLTRELLARGLWYVFRRVMDDQNADLRQLMSRQSRFF